MMTIFGVGDLSAEALDGTSEKTMTDVKQLNAIRRRGLNRLDLGFCMRFVY